MSHSVLSVKWGWGCKHSPFNFPITHCLFLPKRLVFMECSIIPLFNFSPDPDPHQPSLLALLRFPSAIGYLSIQAPRSLHSRSKGAQLLIKLAINHEFFFLFFKMWFLFTDVQNARVGESWGLPCRPQRKVHEGKQCEVGSEPLQAIPEQWYMKLTLSCNGDPRDLKMPQIWDIS